jgi:flagellar protein FliO/FliZ
LKKYALFLCAVIWALGAGVVATAQGAQAPSAAQAAGAGTAGALGNAQAVDETTLAIGDQPGAQTGVGGRAAGPNTTAYFIRMILVLALVLGLIYVVFRIMKRLAKPKIVADSSVRLLAQASLGPGRAVHLIGVGDKAWLVGSSENSVSLIAEIEDRELIDELALKAATAPLRAKADFASVLNSVLGKQRRPARKGRAAAAGDAVGDAVGDNGPDFLARQRERLRKF